MTTKNSQKIILMNDYPITLKELKAIKCLSDVLENLTTDKLKKFLFVINVNYLSLKEFYLDKFSKNSEIQKLIISLKREITTQSSNDLLKQSDVNLKTKITQSYPEISKEIKTLKEIQLALLDRHLKERNTDISQLIATLDNLSESFNLIESSYKNITNNSDGYLEYEDNKKSSKQFIFIRHLYSKFKEYTGIETKYITDREDYQKITGAFFELVKICFNKANIYISDESLKKKISSAFK